MYALESNPTVARIIARSVTCHPMTLIDTLDAAAREERRYLEARRAEGDRNGVCRIIAKRAAIYESASQAVVESTNAQETAVALSADMSSKIQVGQIAATLQCLPRHILSEAMTRT